MTTPHRRPARRAVGIVMAVLLGLAPLATVPAATAVEPAVEPTVEPAVEPAPGLPPAGPPAAAVLPSTTSSEYFDTPRDLTGCPYRTTPPAPVDQSEVPLPGQPSPAPPPVPEPAAGDDAALSGCEVMAPAGFEVPLEVTASAWMVSDLDTGEVVAARDPHGRYRPASLIKTLLASVALDALEAERVIEVSDTDLQGAEGSLVGVGPGGRYSVERLLSGLLMGSGNDAATVLAHQLGGIDRTLAEMNAHAAQLGARDTHVATVSGLDGPGMMSSAHDLSVIFRDAMTRPPFARIVASTQTGFPGYPAGEGTAAPDPESAPPAPAGPTVRADGTQVNPGFVLANDNLLLYNYPGAIGGKTGFTDDARHTFIGAAERDGRRLAVVLLDGTRVPAAPWEQAGLLLDAGFAADGSVGRLATGPGSESGSGSPTDGTTEQFASGPLAGQGASAETAGRAADDAPWVAVLVVVVLLVSAGGVAALRSRR